MKRLTFCCHGCGKTKQFSGLTVDELLTAIDKSGWVDEPHRAWCPACWREEQDAIWRCRVVVN